jgi:hypothetical protein
MTEKHYSYNARWLSISMVGLFFGLGAVILAFAAATNERGMTIEGFIRLDKDAATKVLWGLAVGSLLFVLAAMAVGVRRLVRPRILLVDSKGLFLPHGFLQHQQSRIDFSEILLITELQQHGQTFLKLKTGPRTFSIAESLLESRSHYDEIKSLLIHAVPGPAVPGT